jgi:uncharacterized protein involved in exopolysaccharide biosynthesis
MKSTNTEGAGLTWWDDAVDLRGLLRLFWSRRVWILLPAGLCSVGAYAVAWLVEPQYEVATVLIPANTDSSAVALGSSLGQLGGLASLAGFGVPLDDSATEEALAVLRSRQFTERFIAERGLVAALYPDAWDAAANRCALDTSACPTLARAFRRFTNDVREITVDRESGLVTLSIRWRDGEQAATWANDLVQRLNEEMRARAIAKSEASLAYLQRELQTTSQIETREAINSLVESQVKQRMLANVSAEYSFRVVDTAIAPDPRDPVWPRKLLFALLGGVAGVILGVGAALLALEFAQSPQKI